VTLAHQAAPVPHFNDLAGRVAVVTGGSKGIGAATCRALAANGVRVAVVAREQGGIDSLVQELQRSGAESIGFSADCTSWRSIEGMRSGVEAAFGPIEVLICSAGVTDDTLLLRMGEDKWANVIETNLTAVYRATRRALGPMVRARRGRIVLVSSVVAFMGSPGQANYGASKAALVGFARSLAREVASRSITVNVVAPGVVATDMIAALGAERVEALTSMVPLGRQASPEEVAAAIEIGNRVRKGAAAKMDAFSSNLRAASAPVTGGAVMEANGYQFLGP